jgi:2',3'-cyclic-nucleotide 2'-phosphodiesterase (5'-nucleotidase family)
MGTLTGEDVFYTLSFNYTIDRVVLRGNGLRTLFESMAGNLCPESTCWNGAFLQMSGLRAVYDVFEGNVGSRVSVLQVPCDGGESWCDVDDEAEYIVAVNNYLATGGAGPVLDFPSVILEHTPGTTTDYEAFRDFIEANSPIAPTIEDRIVVNYGALPDEK